MSLDPARDILVVLREELAHAHELLAEVALLPAAEQVELEPYTKSLEQAAGSLDARIRAQFDDVLLKRASQVFTGALNALKAQLSERAQLRLSSHETAGLVHRLAAATGSVVRVAEHNRFERVATAMRSLAVDSGWSGPLLTEVVHLVDVLTHLARRRLGEDLGGERLQSLLNRAVNTVVISTLHAVSDAAKRHNPDLVLLDRYLLSKALEMPVRQLVARLGEWFGLDGLEQHQTLEPPVRRFVETLVGRLEAAARGE